MGGAEGICDGHMGRRTRGVCQLGTHAEIPSSIAAGFVNVRFLINTLIFRMQTISTAKAKTRRSPPPYINPDEFFSQVRMIVSFAVEHDPNTIVLVIHRLMPSF